MTLAQVVKPGAKLIYGSFASNVDMMSGAPALGTPEYTKAAFASGQIARTLGMPLRSSNTTSSNCVDAQAAYESEMSLWGSIMGGANLVYHATGWLEGGLVAVILVGAGLPQLPGQVRAGTQEDPRLLGRRALGERNLLPAEPRLALRGLMAIPQPESNPAQQHGSFAQLRQLQTDLIAQGIPLDTLSMGMSHDLEAAILEGATIVRVGRAIFGPRPTHPRQETPCTTAD